MLNLNKELDERGQYWAEPQNGASHPLAESPKKSLFERLNVITLQVVVDGGSNKCLPHARRSVELQPESDKLVGSPSLLRGISARSKTRTNCGH